MNFHHFVKRYTRVVFIFIVIVMVVPLLLWGYMSPSDPDRGPDIDAGVIFKSIPVKKRMFDEQMALATATYHWQKRQFETAPKNEELVRLAWEQIVLLQDARDHGVSAGEADTYTLISRIYMMLTGGRPQEPYRDAHLPIMAGIFKLSPSMFETWLNQRALIDKHLRMISESSFAEYERAYDAALGQDQLVKVSYASFDPKEYERELKPVRPDEVARYFEANKQRFKVPEKIQVSYLMAETDAFKKGAAEPTETEIAKHYEETKAQYLIPAPEHEHKPGDPPHREDEPRPPPEYKPLSEVREQVIDGRKTAVAREQALKVMEQADIEVGALKKDGRYPDNVLESVREKIQRERKIELVHDITAAFDSAHVDEVEKSVGRDSRLSAWGFDKSRAVGDVSEKVVTDKGVVIFRLQVKKEAYDPDLNEQIRGRVTRLLEQQQLRARASQQANNLVQEIGTRGIAAARLRHAWKSTGYFRPSAGAPIDIRSIASQVGSQIQRGSLKTGAATVLSSPQWDTEYRDFAHVVYLEDRVTAPPEDLEGAFRQSRDGFNREARMRAQENYVTSRMRDAAVQDFVNKTEEKKPAPAPAPAPKVTLPAPAPKK